MYKIFTALLVLSILSGCTMIPGYKQPDFAAASTWGALPGHTEAIIFEKSAGMLKWDAFFTSPELRKVITAALENNKDLRLAMLNIEEARNLYRINRADLVPSLNANGGGVYQKTSDESSTTGRAMKSEAYNANLSVSAYELDLFGQVRSRNESSFNEYLATTQAKDVVRIALIAETANAYLQLLADEKLLFLTQQTLYAQLETYDILSKSLESGISTEQDVARATTSVETARANYHQYSRFIVQDKNALFLLMGIPYDDAFLPTDVSLDTIKLKENLEAGIPSEVLLLRPDVKQAEYLLRARNADIGAARAAFFPSISLTGNFGFASQGLANLFTSGAAGAYSFLPQITVPIFEGGRNKANLNLAEIRKDQAILVYEKAIQAAFRDVSNELIARETLDKQLASQQRLVSAAQKVYDISDARYKSGIDSFLDVLDAQRELYTYQQNEIEIQRQHQSNFINLYKALGGGL